MKEYETQTFRAKSLESTLTHSGWGDFGGGVYYHFTLSDLEQVTLNSLSFLFSY